MRISDLALENRTSVFVFMIIIVVVGSVCYIMLPREAAPDIQVPFVGVSTTYEGVAPSDMETLVTMKIEKELKALKDVKEIRSSSVEGMSNITIEFEPDVDIDDALQKVRDKVDLAEPELPADIDDEPVVTEYNFSDWPILYININGPDLVLLKEIGDRLEVEVEAIAGVLDVEVTGGLEREIRIEFDPDRLAAYGVAPSEALAAVAQNNVNIPSGSLELGEANYVVKVPGEFKDPAEIDHIVIAMRNGYPIYLPDVARVVDGFEEQTSYARVNGQPAVTLGVVKRSGENIIRITDQVKEILEGAKPLLPSGVSISTTADQSEDIRMMVSDLENNLLSGLLLIMIVIFLSLGFRDAILVSMAIPFSMLISFGVLAFLGITLNMVVLFSLTLSLGMLVDNAIVIVENIHRHHQGGLRRIAAAHVATREVAWPITTSCLTTLCAFFPLLFWPGIIGEFMVYLPRTALIALSSSLLVALIITPCVSAVLMKKKMDHQRPAFTDSWIVQTYVRFLNLMLRHRWTTVVLAGGMLVVVGWWFLVSGLGTEFFPKAEPKRASINIKLPEGSALHSSDTIVRRAEEAVMRYPEADVVIANVGSGAGTFGQPGGRGANHASVSIEFIDRELREIPSSQVVEMLRDDLADISGAEVTVEEAEEGPPTGAPISLEISGDHLETIGHLAREARGILNTIEGVVDVKDDFVLAKPELRVRIDKEKAALMGLTTQMIGQIIRTSIQGAKAGIFRVGNEEYDVIVRLPKSGRSEIDTLARLRIHNAYGADIPLSSVAEFEWASGLGSITRVDERRTVSVTANVSEGHNANAVLARAKAKMSESALPPGYVARFTGQNKDMQESMAFLSKAFLATILLIALVLVMQFDSVTLPFIILTSVILSLVGVLLSLLVMRQPFGIIMTGVAVISLAGVVVNNSIVLIDYTEKLRAKGFAAADAIVQACSVRFRPVVLTAITTILGLIPMATGVSFDFRALKIVVGSESSQFWAPMAIAVIFGLALATILTLGVVPALYLILAPLRGRSHRTEEHGDVEIEAPEAAV